MTQASLLPVTRDLVPEDQRLVITEQLFGMAFTLQLEPVVYGVTDRITQDYTCGYWNLYTLSNGCIYKATSEDRIIQYKLQNMYEGDLSADALGITACLYAYSNLSFSLSDIARECTRHYHLMREYSMEHPEVRQILAATD